MASASTSFTPSSIQASPTRSANLIGWWKFDDDTNATVKDSSGNNNHGLIKNSSHANVSTQHKTDTLGQRKGNRLEWQPLRRGFNLGEDTFDGGNQFSIAFWTKDFPDDGWDPFIAKRGESGQGWQMRRYSGEQKVSFTLRGPGGDDSLRPTISVINWTHLAGVWGGGKLKIFANGELVASEDRSGAVSGPTRLSFSEPKIIPAITIRLLPILGITQACGWMASFYSVFLSDTEVSSIYGGGLGGVGQPWITVNSSATATAATGMAFTYQITATNNPTSYSLADAPSWMSVNAATVWSRAHPPQVAW